MSNYLFERFARETYKKHNKDLPKLRSLLDGGLRRDAKLRASVIERELAEIREEERLRKGQTSSDTHRSGALPGGGGQTTADTHGDVAAASDVLPKGHSTSDTHEQIALPGSGGQTVPDTHIIGAAAPNERTILVKKHNVKEFHRVPARSESQKKISNTAMLVGSSTWRVLGMEKLRYREIDAFIAEQSEMGGMWVHKGSKHVLAASVAWLVKQHGKPSDDSVLVSDVISDNELSKLMAKAMKSAPEITAKIAAAATSSIAENVRLIAAE